VISIDSVSYHISAVPYICLDGAGFSFALISIQYLDLVIQFVLLNLLHSLYQTELSFVRFCFHSMTVV